MPSQPMPAQCLIAQYKSLQDAELGLRILATDHFTNESVSVVSKHDKESMSELDPLKSTHTQSPPTDGAAAVGAMTGGAIATPLAVSTLIGPFMVAGPLAGMAVGAAAGALLSQTDQWGVDHDVAANYEQQVMDGAVLVIVNDDDPIRIDDAHRLLHTSEHESIERYQVEGE